MLSPESNHFISVEMHPDINPRMPRYKPSKRKESGNNERSLETHRSQIRLKLKDSTHQKSLHLKRQHTQMTQFNSIFRRRHLLDGSTFALADAEVLPSRNLGVYFDSCLTRTAHVSQLVRSCFYQLRRIKTIRKFIPTSITLSWSTASLSPGLTSATAYWRVCRFAS